MKRGAQQIHVPNLDPKFVRERNPDGNWLVDHFNNNISLLNSLAETLPQSLEWNDINVQEFNFKMDRLFKAGRGAGAELAYWIDLLGQVQAFGLLSAWRLTEIVSSSVWAIRRNDPICAAIMARAAMETSANYAYFQSKFCPMLNSSIGTNSFLSSSDMENDLLKTLWASRLDGTHEDYSPVNILTILNHIAKKIPHQEAVTDFYAILCEVAHPNMLGRSIYMKPKGQKTIISRTRGPSAIIIEHAALFALSWASGTLPKSISAMQSASVDFIKDRQQHLASLSSVNL